MESIIAGLFKVGEEELSQWRKAHRESVRRERGGKEGGEGAETHEEVGLTKIKVAYSNIKSILHAIPHFMSSNYR